MYVFTSNNKTKLEGILLEGERLRMFNPYYYHHSAIIIGDDMMQHNRRNNIKERKKNIKIYIF